MFGVCGQGNCYRLMFVMVKTIAINWCLLWLREKLSTRAPDKRGISALIFGNSALKIKLKGENTLCSLRFQC